MKSVLRCQSKTWDKIPPPGQMTQCRLPEGHEEQHTDGAMTWCEEGDCRCGKLKQTKLEYRPFASRFNPTSA